MNTIFGWICGALIVAKYAAQLWLERLNRRHVENHASEIPPSLRCFVEPTTYSKSVEYTLAKSRFNTVVLTWNTLWLGVILLSGSLPWLYQNFQGAFGSSAWAGAGFLVSVAVVLGLPGLPLEWHAQFHLEQRFGFNTTTPKTWWTDRVKGLLLGLALGYPLLVLILQCVQRLGSLWWLWAWGCVVLFQLIMMIAAPVLILPLFNKFTPLPEGPLREQLLALAERTGFHAKDIQIMDGSKRSRHSNAFFTGLGRFRKIVLFDTLVAQLDALELEAVLAHEIGHYKKHHIVKMVAWSVVSLFVVFWGISILLQQAWFFRSFGFEPGALTPALLIFGLLSGVFTFWFSPLGNLWSRRYEYQADAFAAKVIHQGRPLILALRKLSEKNLSNLTPHPFYSGFYYSHPTLVEREKALDGE